MNSVGKLKTKASARTIPIPPELCDALDHVRGIGETFVFQGIIAAPKQCLEAYKDTWESLRKALYEADSSIESIGADNKKRSMLTSHYYRHNSASILYNAGIDVLTAQKWVVIDDIDRLNNEQIRQVFQLISSVAKFPNTSADDCNFSRCYHFKIHRCNMRLLIIKYFHSFALPRFLCWFESSEKVIEAIKY